MNPLYKVGDKTGVKIVDESYLVPSKEDQAKICAELKGSYQMYGQKKISLPQIPAYEGCTKTLEESDKEEKPEPKFEVGDRVKIHYPDTNFHDKKAKITKIYCHKSKYSYDIDLEVTDKPHSILGLSEDKLKKVSSQPELDFG